MLGNYKHDYRLKGNLPGDRQRSVTKKETKKETKEVNKETHSKANAALRYRARRQKVTREMIFQD